MKKKNNNSAISNYREKINAIDYKIVSLLNQRLSLAKKIGDIKKKFDLPVFDPVRENEIISRIKKINSGFPDNYLENIYSDIMAASRLFERKLKIIYLGPEGSFTHIAAKNKFPESDLIYANSISSVFTEVEKNNGDYGIAPIENSNNGIVTYTLDKLLTTSLNITGEIMLKVSHYLISKETKINRITTVYSHPQSFGQCENWMLNHLQKDIKLIPVDSNSLAAEIAAQKKGCAAISSELSAKIYNLNILAEKIEDYKNNMTRFYVIGKQKNPATGNDKTSIAFAAKDRTGILYKCLEPFAKNNISLSKIESRPFKNVAWNYVFFADFSGHIDDPIIQGVLKKLDNYCSFIKHLGSYPVFIE
ncbi:MAG TPA: prephenate dehydratase [bacterium]|nr:prephenate dehydratase [bacterium]HPN31212.1 prephenate dehydratase [bacterium]